jgi:hypothetical protein
MAESEKLSTLPPERISQHYSALRDTSLKLIGHLAAETWTDHNVHDPGITFAEAYIYALTDVAFRTQLSMRNLLRSGEKIAPPALPPAHRVLPCAPVTAADLRSVLLDHYLIKDAAVSATHSYGIAFYRDDSLSPPLTYSTGDERVRLQGLYEVLIEFQNVELNSNNYALAVDHDGNTYSLNIALPHWDEVESSVFHEEVTIDNVALLDEGDGIWRPLEETLTYFAQAQIDFTGAAGAGTQEVWLVLHIVDALTNPAALAPNILTAAEAVIESNAADSLIVNYAARVVDAHNGVAKIRRYLYAWRNLTEVPARIAVVRQQEIAVHARIEMNNGIDLELLVAKIFAAIDLELSPPSQLNTLSDLVDLGLGSTDIYNGPLLRHGFLQTPKQNDYASTVPEEIFTSDILRIIMRQRGGDESDISHREIISGRDILAVSNLTLSNYVNNRLITKNARNCLRLVEVQRYRPRLSVAKSRLVLVRDDIEIPYDFLRVEELFQQMLDERNADAISEVSTVTWPTQRGEDFPINDYFPFQNELPRVYGVGEAGLPGSAGTKRKAQALQTKGYLLLAEQFLADSTAQLANINRFFSPATEEDKSYFTQPIFDLPGIQKLIKRFPADGDWAAFITDPDNPYQHALQAAIENRTQLIDRRNRMLDHLLARHSVQALAWAQELHRLAYEELKNAGLPTVDFQTQLVERRLRVNADLIDRKVAFLAAVPQLNATRMQAFGNAARWSDVIEVVGIPGAYVWHLVLDGDVVLEAATESPTQAEAYISAEEAIVLATETNFYGVLSSSGQHIFILRNGPAATDTEIGHSIDGWPSIAAAQSQIDETAAGFSALTLENSLTSFERIVAHQCGFNSRQRRRLLTATDSYFEIYDEIDSDSVIEKRWRLWSEPGFNGDILLSSAIHYVAPPEIIDPTAQEAAATELAQEAIEQVQRHGIHPWSYHVLAAGPDTYNFDLRITDGETIALSIPPLATAELAEQAIQRTVMHLRDLFSAEGFHLVEHILLRPQENGDPFLAIPTSESEHASDPYSHRMSLVFSSGYARDFALPVANAPREAVRPHRFRDKEARKYVQRVVEQHCPAHILPTLYWVDQQLPGTADDPGSFDSFEERYFAWLAGILTPGTGVATLSNTQSELIDSLNAIVNG